MMTMILISSAVLAVLFLVWLAVRIGLRHGGSTMPVRRFLGRLVGGGGYRSVGPAALAGRDQAGGGYFIDLREPSRFDAGHLPGAQSVPFDDFLRRVVVEGFLAERRHDEVVLVCDNGHMSRVAAAVLAEDEGFTNVVNLRGGMAAWERWRKRQEQNAGCCHVRALVARCCPRRT